MTQIHAKFDGVGKSLPAKIITNADLEKIVETSDEWITTRTGIKERRVLDKGESITDHCVAAAKEALENAQCDPEELDLIINCTFTSDYILPAGACVVQDKLGIKRDVPAFDLAAACSGFMFGIETANNFISTGNYKKILVIGADALTRFTNWKDRGTCVLFGDGAGAAVLSGTTDPGVGVISSDLGSVGKHHRIIMVEGGGSAFPADQLINDPSMEAMYKITMDGNTLFKIVTRLVVDSVKRAIERGGITPADIDFLIPHQANTRIIEFVAEKVGLPLEKCGVTIHKYGNNSAGSVPVALCDSLEAGKIKKGDNIIMTGFGGGLTYASLLVKWG
jgi:3-oxoacyl-[acyl-carrier-protein] synthase-3